MINPDLNKFLDENKDKKVWLLIPSGLIQCTAYPPGRDESTPLEIEGAVYYLNEKRLPMIQIIIRPDQVYGWAKVTEGVIDFEEWGKSRD